MFRELIRLIRERDDEPWLGLLCSYLQVLAGCVRVDVAINLSTSEKHRAPEPSARGPGAHAPWDVQSYSTTSHG